MLNGLDLSISIQSFKAPTLFSKVLYKTFASILTLNFYSIELELNQLKNYLDFFGLNYFFPLNKTKYNKYTSRI